MSEASVSSDFDEVSVRYGPLDSFLFFLPSGVLYDFGAFPEALRISPAIVYKIGSL